MIVAIIVKDVEAVAQRRTRPDTVKAEEDEEETQYMIMTKTDKARYVILAKEEEKTHAQVSGRG